MSKYMIVYKVYLTDVVHKQNRRLKGRSVHWLSMPCRHGFTSYYITVSHLHTLPIKYINIGLANTKIYVLDLCSITEPS